MELRLVRHDAVDSTNERALEEAARGTARHGDVHVARRQTRGRGRLGRVWESAPDEGLYLTVLLLPPAPPSPVALTMAAGLAVLGAARALGLAAAALDWPNDVAVRGAKLAGILVESRSRGADPPHFAVGVGLNVAQRSFSPELTAERAVTSLALEGIDCGVERALAAALEALGRELPRAFDAPDAVARDYAAALGLRGERVRAAAGERRVEGRLVELTPAGGLVVETAAGRRERLPLEHVTRLERQGTA